MTNEKENIKKALGNKIRTIRKAKKLTQEKLAELIEIETPNLSHIENGKFAPSIETLQKISRAFEIEPWELYKFDEYKSSYEIKEEMFKTFNENEKLLKVMYQIFLSLRFMV